MTFCYVLEELVAKVGLGEMVNVSATHPNLRRDDFLEVRTQVWAFVGVTEKREVAEEFLSQHSEYRRVHFVLGKKNWNTERK